jgi:hypothetical protein
LRDELQTPPKNGRIDKYNKEFSELLERLKNTSDPSAQKHFEEFLGAILRDCQIYLNKQLGAEFPNFTLIFVYNKDQFDEWLKKLEKIFGKTPYSRATIFKLRYENPIMLINVQDHLVGKPMQFIIDISISFIEELVHLADSEKSETEIHDLVCSMIEGFLEMRLPESVKQERLRIAKEYDAAVRQ